MVNNSVIKECLFPVVGFKQTIDTKVDRIDADIVESTSDIFVDHPLLTATNITACTENFKAYTIDVFDALVSYAKGALVYKIVSTVKTYYISLLTGNIGNDPEASPIQWKKTTLLSNYIRGKFNDSISKVVNQAITNKQLTGIAKGFYGEVKLYEGVGNIYNRETKNNRFVGFILRVKNQDTNITLKKIGLQLDTANPAFKLYVYHSSNVNPLLTIDIVHSKVVDTQWTKITDTVLSFASDNINFGGEYYIGYYEQDLVGQAVNKEHKFTGAGCSTCDPINLGLFQKWNDFAELQPFYVDSNMINYATKEIWPVDKETRIDGKTFGLNFVGSMNCDVTDLFCRNSNIFANSLKLQVEVDMLKDMAYGNRENQKFEKVASMAMYALDNRDNHTKGIAKELENALQALNFDTSDVSPKCLPCMNNGKTATIRSVWR